MDAVEDIKSRLSIEDVVSQYVELKRAGRNFKGLSPFGNERTPSFMVSPEKQIWHDFSSGKGGNMFSFVMEMEGLDFKGALELLARKAGVDLEQYRGRSSSNTKEKERLFQALELATKFFEKYLHHFHMPRAYVLEKRKFTLETVQQFRLGYAPKENELMKFMQIRGFTVDELKRAGLVARRYHGPGDMFRDRLMVPLQDAQGRVIGFTARLLADDPDAPKYINTPQTLLYDKSRHVYGLHLAKEALRKAKYAVLVEGNLDVIASHQAGVRQTVATAGTALTEYQLKALGRFTPDIRLSFDADNAGLNATERAIPIASKVGVSLSIITIPSGKDPDELTREDPGKWREIIEKPKYALDWLIDRYKKQLDIESAVGKREFSDIILRVVRGLDDQVEQEHYVDKLSKIIGVSREALQSKLAGAAPAPKLRPKKTENRPLDKIALETIKTENHLLALALLQPKLREFITAIKPQMLVEEQAGQLLTFLQEHPDFDGKTAPAPLRSLADYVKMLLLLFEELYQDLEFSDLRYEATQLQASLVKIYVRNQKQRIAHELQTSSEARTAELLEAAKRLDNLLKNP